MALNDRFEILGRSLISIRFRRKIIYQFILC